MRKSGERRELARKEICIRSSSVQQLLSSILDEGPESPLLMLISKDGLNCTATKVDQIISAQIECLGDQKIFIAEFAIKDANIIRLH